MNGEKGKVRAWVGLLPAGVLVANLFALGLLYAYTHLNLRPFLPAHDTVRILGQPMIVFNAFLFLLPTAASVIFLWPVFEWPASGEPRAANPLRAATSGVYFAGEFICRWKVWPVIFAGRMIAGDPGIWRVGILHRLVMFWATISFFPLSV